MEKLEPSFSGGNVKWCSQLVEQFRTLQRLKRTLAIRPTNPSPRYLQEREEDVLPYKVSHRNVYSSIVHNSQNLEPVQTSRH